MLKTMLKTIMEFENKTKPIAASVSADKNQKER